MISPRADTAAMRRSLLSTKIWLCGRCAVRVRSARPVSRRSSPPARSRLHGSSSRTVAGRAATWSRTACPRDPGGASSSSTRRSARRARRAEAPCRSRPRANRRTPSRTVGDRFREQPGVPDGEVEPLGTRRRDDVGGVAREEEPAVTHRLDDEAPHRRHALLDDRSLRELPPRLTKPRLELGPDAIVRPTPEVLIRLALEIEPAELGRAKAQQRKAAVVVGVDELVARGSDRREDPSHPYGYSRT